MDDLTKKIAQLLVKASSDENYEKRLAAIIDNEYNLQYGEDKKEVVANSETKAVSEEKEQVETKQKTIPVTTIFDEPRETASIKEENVETKQEEKKKVDIKQDEFSHFEIDIENISNEASCGIKVYDHNKRSYNSFMRSSGISEQDETKASSMMGYLSRDNSFISLQRDGSCEIIYSVNELFEYVKNNNPRGINLERSARGFPQLILKLSKEQLMAIDINEDTKFSFANGMSLMSILSDSCGKPSYRLPKIRVPFTNEKHKKYKTKDLNFMRQFMEVYGIIKNNESVSLNDVINGYHYNEFQCARIAFTNDGEQLNIQEMIELAQMIYAVSGNETLRKEVVFLSGSSISSEYCGNRMGRNLLQDNDSINVNCIPNPSNKEIFNLNIDIKDGLCSYKNVQTLYNFVNKVGGNTIFQNASRVEQILSDTEQGKEPTVASAQELVNIYKREITKRSRSGYVFKESGGNFGYFIDKGKNERLKCKYDALKNISLLAKECHYDGIVNDEELEHLRVVSETQWFDRINLYLNTVDQNQKAATHSAKK